MTPEYDSNLRASLHQRWMRRLKRDILDMDVDTVCGRRVEAICAMTDALLKVVEEDDTREAIISAVVRDVEVIVHG